MNEFPTYLKFVPEIFLFWRLLDISDHFIDLVFGGIRRRKRESFTAGIGFLPSKSAS